MVRSVTQKEKHRNNKKALVRDFCYRQDIHDLQLCGTLQQYHRRERPPSALWRSAVGLRQSQI